VVTRSEGIRSEGRWERFAPLSGIVAVVLFVVGFILFEAVGDTPDDDATAEAYLSYFREEDGSIWFGAWVFLVGIFFFLWFLGSLREAFARAEGAVGRLTSIAYTGGIGAALVFSSLLAVQISGAIAADEGDNLTPEAAQALWWVGDGFFFTTSFFLAALYAASALITLRTRILPLWLGIVSAILALASLIPFISWATLIFATPIWTIIVSILLYVRRATPAAGAGGEPVGAAG
jgi:hypothetical protein